MGDLTVGMTATQRPNQFYDLKDPKTGKKYSGNPDRVWAFIPSSMEQLIKEKRVYFPIDTSKRPMQKRFKSELKSDVNPISTLLKVGMNSEATREFREIFGKTLFNYSKPISLLQTLIKQSTNKNDIVLDFFGGSGSICQSVLEANIDQYEDRKFICVQLPEQTDVKSEAFKAGYKTIADIAKERIRRVIKKIEAEQEAQKKKKAEQLDFKDENEKAKPDLGFKVFRLQRSNFKIWRSDTIGTEQQFGDQLEVFTDPVKESSEVENMLYELLLKSGFDLNSRIEAKSHYFIINKNEMVVALTKMSEEIVAEILALKPAKCITLDKLFNKNDQLKTNTVLHMRDAGVAFRTI